MSGKLSVSRVVLLVLAFSASVPLVFAHSGATGPTKERMEAMSATKDRLKTVRAATTVDGVDESSVEQALDKLEAFAAQLPDPFVDRHLPEVSEALPKIWEKPEQFKAEIRFFDQKLN